jgi:hypothetical protein
VKAALIDLLPLPSCTNNPVLTDKHACAAAKATDNDYQTAFGQRLMANGFWPTAFGQRLLANGFVLRNTVAMPHRASTLTTAQCCLYSSCAGFAHKQKHILVYTEAACISHPSNPPYYSTNSTSAVLLLLLLLLFLITTTQSKDTTLNTGATRLLLVFVAVYTAGASCCGSCCGVQLILIGSHIGSGPYHTSSLLLLKDVSGSANRSWCCGSCADGCSLLQYLRLQASPSACQPHIAACMRGIATNRHSTLTTRVLCTCGASHWMICLWRVNTNSNTVAAVVRQ